jgi:hypothetical protein
MAAGYRTPGISVQHYLPLPLLVTLILLPGCQREEEIVHYRVPRLEPVARAEAKKEPVRFLGAIFPAKGESWFARVQGAEARVTPLVDAFETFVKSFRFTGKADEPITWTLPPGWEKDRERDESKAIFKRFATIKLKDQPELEVVVAQAGGTVLDNVNRWRGQIGLKPLAKQDLAGETKTLDVAGVSVTVVNMVGASGGLQRPMAGGDDGRPPFAGLDPGKLPKFTVKTPPGWTEQKPKSPDVTAKQYDAGQGVRVTITALGGDGGGLPNNINRWRTDELGLRPASIDELAQASEFIALGVGKALIVDMENPKKQGSPRVVAVVVFHAQQTWFLKMFGPSEAVGRERANFEAFAQSLRFDKE